MKEHSFIILKITLEIAVFRYDHGWQIQGCDPAESLRTAPSKEPICEEEDRWRQQIERCSLFLSTNLQMDDALFTLLTKRILYTGNACGCEFLCSMWGSLFISTSIPDLHSLRLRPFSSKTTYGYIWWQGIHVVD